MDTIDSLAIMIFFEIFRNNDNDRIIFDRKCVILTINFHHILYSSRKVLFGQLSTLDDESDSPFLVDDF